MAALCRQQSPLIALGILSPPEYVSRRLTQRYTWMRYENVGHDGHAAICALFVVRTGGAPARLSAAMTRESSVYGDMLFAADVRYNESRVRGPVLCLGWWLLYAAREMRHARFIGKVDDDTYLHAPDVELLLRQTQSQLGPSANVYLGVLTYYHWYTRLFDRTRHAWTMKQAFEAGKWCRSTDLKLPAHLKVCGPEGCGRCIGPFLFASGFLVVLSSPLLADVASSDALPSEMAAFRAIEASHLIDKAGDKITLVMEDVWFGSVLFRFPPREPIKYITLLYSRGRKLHVDEWDLRITRSALLVHNPNKAPARLLALHAAMDSLHCPVLSPRLECVPVVIPKRWIASAGAGGRSDHSWCSVQSNVTSSQQLTLMRGAGSSAASTAAPCCTADGPGNSSCGAVFGSNKWAKPFSGSAAQLENYGRACFTALGRMHAMSERARVMCTRKLALT